MANVIGTLTGDASDFASLIGLGCAMIMADACTAAMSATSLALGVVSAGADELGGQYAAGAAELGATAVGALTGGMGSIGDKIAERTGYDAATAGAKYLAKGVGGLNEASDEALKSMGVSSESAETSNTLNRGISVIGAIPGLAADVADSVDHGWQWY